MDVLLGFVGGCWGVDVCVNVGYVVVCGGFGGCVFGVVCCWIGVIWVWWV